MKFDYINSTIAVITVNEETVKNNIVVPFFRELGFDISEIEYETS